MRGATGPFRSHNRKDGPARRKCANALCCAASSSGYAQTLGCKARLTSAIFYFHRSKHCVPQHCAHSKADIQTRSNVEPLGARRWRNLHFPSVALLHRTPAELQRRMPGTVAMMNALRIHPSFAFILQLPLLKAKTVCIVAQSAHRQMTASLRDRDTATCRPVKKRPRRGVF